MLQDCTHESTVKVVQKSKSVYPDSITISCAHFDQEAVIDGRAMLCGGERVSLTVYIYIAFLCRAQTQRMADQIKNLRDVQSLHQHIL